MIQTIKTQISLFLLLVLAGTFSHAQNCKTLPVPSIDCAAKSLIADGWLADSNQNQWDVYQWPTLLTSKDSLQAYAVDRNKPISLNSPKWFFYVDKWPGAVFEHQTEFILVDQKTGAIRSSVHMGYPIINGISYFAQPIEPLVKKYIPKNFGRFPLKGAININAAAPFLALPKLNIAPALTFEFAKPVTPDGKLDEAAIDYTKYPKKKGESKKDFKRRVRGYYEKSQSPQQATTEANKCECKNPSAKIHVLVISGYSADGEHDDFDKLARYYLSLGHPVTYLRSRASEFQQAGLKATETTMPRIKKAFISLASKVNDCCDQVMVFIGGHGSLKGSIEMNPKGTEETYFAGKSSTPATYHDKGHAKGGNLRTAQLSKYLNLLKTCKTQVYLFSCFSGEHLRKGLNQVPKKLVTKGCLCRTTYTSSSHRQASYYSDYWSLFKQIRNSKGDLKTAFLNHQEIMRKQFDKTNYDTKRNALIQSTDCILCKDNDKDGLINGIELKDNYSDPTKKHTDKDGLDDYYEKTQSKTNPRKEDSDGDKLLDNEEVELGTDPNDKDTDDDGLNDKYETFLTTDPLKKDTDEDGLTDGDEVLKYRTKPLVKDTDGDKVNDGDEVEAGTDPLDPKSK